MIVRSLKVQGTDSYRVNYAKNTFEPIAFLPVEYQQVEYIQSTGTQRIKTNITPTSKYKIEEEFAIIDRGVTSCLWCARGSNTGAYSTTAFNIANSQVRCDYGASASMINIGAINVNQRYKLTMDSEKWYLDDVLKTTMSAATFTSGSKLQLMASHYNGIDSNLDNWAKLKLYKFSVWDANRNLVGNFIPCYRKVDNVAGLYDTVGKAFYSNNGSGTFGVGPDVKRTIMKFIVPLPKYEYQQVEYIANVNGNQYLHIPFIPNASKGFKFEFDMTPTATGKRYCLIANYNVGSAQVSLELNTSNKARFWANTGNLDKSSSNSFSTSNINKLIYEFKNNTWTINLNETITTGSYTWSSTSSADYMRMFLDRAGRTSTFPTPIKIYSCTIYEEEEDDESIFHATLLKTLMEDIALIRIYTPETMYEYRNAILSAIDLVVRIQSAMSIVLKKICNKEPFNIAEEIPILQHSGCEQHIWMEKTLKTEYYFRSEANYYRYLFLLFLSKKPRVAKCQCCGSYFIPKTNKKTLYCDRIISNGKTCKQIAPTLKHKLNVMNDEVLKTFDRVKQKMYKRYERENLSLEQLPHGLTWREYQAWHTKAMQARDAYVAGKLSAEEAIKIINDIVH